MKTSKLIQETFKRHEGIFRLIPNFVPRRFGQPGHRLRLHPDDYFALGTRRGAIKERWFSSTTPAINGPLAPKDEGMSYVAPAAKIAEKFSFCDAVSELGSDLVGSFLKKKYGGWPMYAKFFDFETPLFHHLHLDSKSAKRVGRLAKPEAYYFPAQLNNHMGQFPVTYFGVDPDVTKDELRKRLMMFEDADNRITELSKAYRIELGTGWYTPPGVLHAPGSVLTYEPQWNSDVNSVYENVAAKEVYPYEFLSEHCPEDRKRNIDYILSLLDWPKNVDPNYRKTYFRPPIVCTHNDDRHVEKWIVYGNEYFGAKELTIQPGQSVVVKDAAAYGCVLIQGHGRFGSYDDAEAASLLRFGQLSGDEYFVSESAAKAGVAITNFSAWEPMVILKHFGPNHPDMPAHAVH